MFAFKLTSIINKSNNWVIEQSEFVEDFYKTNVTDFISKSNITVMNITLNE